MRSNSHWLRVLLFLLSCLWLNLSYAKTLPFQLESGDLLFQDLNCGEFCDSVDSVTYGYHRSYVSHVAMVINSDESGSQVIEALSRGVVATPLTVFLARSLDSHHHPRVMVGRVLPPYRNLIPSAIKVAQSELGKPYNDSFIPAQGKAFYCSELIADSFTLANHGKVIFPSRAMNFADESGMVLPLWQQYYRSLNVAVPQGVLGTNPGAMSRESAIAIIYYYGNLREHN